MEKRPFNTAAFERAQRAYDTTEPPYEIALTECPECGEMYDANEHEHCPCQKECPYCLDLRHKEEKFWEIDDGDDGCSDCVIDAWDEHQPNSQIANLAVTYVSALRKHSAIDVDPATLIELARCMVKAR